MCWAWVHTQSTHKLTHTTHKERTHSPHTHTDIFTHTHANLHTPLQTHRYTHIVSIVNTIRKINFLDIFFCSMKKYKKSNSIFKNKASKSKKYF